MKINFLRKLACMAGPAVSLLLAVALVGCAGYRLGSTLPKNIKTVFVPAFINNTGEPMAETEASRATLEELQKDGTLEVTGEQFANSVLTVTLTSFKLEPLSFDRTSPKTANQYRLFLYADVLFVRAKTNELLAKKKVYGETTFIPSGDLASAKRLALPNVSKDLAHRIVEAMVEYW